MNLRQTRGRVHDRGDIHAPGLDEYGHTTLCGQGSPAAAYEETTQAVDCLFCLDIATKLLVIINENVRRKPAKEGENER